MMIAYADMADGASILYPTGSFNGGRGVRPTCYLDPQMELSGKGIKAEPYVVMPGHTHRLKHYEAIAATCTTSGNSEYWQCAEASAIFARLTDSFGKDASYATSFADVDSSLWYGDYIGFVEGQNIITGYEDGTFHPENNVTRAEFATMIMRFIKLSEATDKDTPFVDISGHWAQKQITACYHEKYIKGYADNLFRPDDYITRAEVVTIINRVLGRKDMKNTQNPFTDVTTGHWAYTDILEAAVTHYVENN